MSIPTRAIEVAIVGTVLIGIAAIRAQAKFDGNAQWSGAGGLGFPVGLLVLITLRTAIARPGRVVGLSS